MKCRKCGCPKKDHEDTRDWGRNSGQCRKHKSFCKGFAEPEPKPELSEVWGRCSKCGGPITKKQYESGNYDGHNGGDETHRRCPKGARQKALLMTLKAAHIQEESGEGIISKDDPRLVNAPEQSTWEIRWKAKVDGKRWKSGKDIVVVKNPDFDEGDAERLLDYFANAHMPDDEHPDMPNFNAYYPNANWLGNFELVSAKRVDKK